MGSCCSCLVNTNTEGSERTIYNLKEIVSEENKEPYLAFEYIEEKKNNEIKIKESDINFKKEETTGHIIEEENLKINIIPSGIVNRHRESFHQVNALKESIKNIGKIGHFSNHIFINSKQNVNNYIDEMDDIQNYCIYKGDIENDLPHGQGELVFDKKNYYKGDFNQGKYHGNGEYNSFDAKYIGSWKDNLRDGVGEEVYPKVKYIGEFKDGMKHGDGVLHLSCGVIVGNFIEGKLNQGKYIKNEILVNGV